MQFGNLGTFSLHVTDPGNPVAATPIFTLSERFVQLYAPDITVQSSPVPGNIPVVPLNLSEVANKTECDRGTIDNCVHEIVQAYGKHVTDIRGLALDFPGIGRLASKYGKVVLPVAPVASHCRRSNSSSSRTFWRIRAPRHAPSLTPRPRHAAQDQLWSRRTLESRCGTAGRFDAGDPPSVAARGATPRLLQTPNYSMKGGQSRHVGPV